MTTRRKPEAKADFSAIVTVRQFSGDFDTRQWFQSDHLDSDVSPIDQFIENAVDLNRMWLGRDSLERKLGMLLILGYVSAVEGFLRALIRRIVMIDPFSQVHCESVTLTYAAARHQPKELLPEAILEEVVFSSSKHVLSNFSKFLDWNLRTNKSIEDLLSRYNAVCELRHCCVHRFGKLGAKNAVELGLESHKAYIEKPIFLGHSSLVSIVDLLFTLVKSINNEAFRFVLERAATCAVKGRDAAEFKWTWNMNKDRKRFLSYYRVFASEKDAMPSPTSADLYRRYRATFINVGQPKPRGRHRAR